MVPTAAELRVAGRVDESEFPGPGVPRERLGDEPGPGVLGPGGPRRDAPRLHPEATQSGHQTRRGHGARLR